MYGAANSPVAMVCKVFYGQKLQMLHMFTIIDNVFKVIQIIMSQC